MLLWSFVSFPPHRSPHDVVTRRAARLVGWPRGAERALLEAVRVPDVAEMTLVPSPSNPRRVRAGSAYDPTHHFDRVPPMSDAEAFEYARDHVRTQRALALALHQDPRSAVQALGRALHAVQDACSHSNLVDLDDDARRRFLDALLDGAPVPPEARLVSYLPGSREPGLPPDDPYPHDRYSKDSRRATAEADRPHGAGTKFDAAVEAATQASATILRSFLADTGLGPRELEPLSGHDTLARTLRAVVAGVAATAAAGALGWRLGRR